LFSSTTLPAFLSTVVSLLCTFSAYFVFTANVVVNFKIDMIWYDTIWYDMIRYDTIWYDMIRYDTIRYDTIRYDTIQYYTIRYSAIQYDTIQYNAIQYDTIRYNIFLQIAFFQAREVRGMPQNSTHWTSVQFWPQKSFVHPRSIKGNPK